MNGKSRTAPAIFGLLAVVLTAMLMIAGPALAGHGGDHGQSDGNGQSGQAHGNESSGADNGGGQANSGGQGSGGGQASGGGSQGGGAGQGSGGWGSRRPDGEPAGGNSGGGGGGKDASKGDHDGDADSDPNTEYTEDNDNDGRANNDDPNPSRHPSGKDRYIEPGGSGNQGKSESDPDGMSNGGADKPNGSGGEDIYDQDGNNGCGNDQDFEDDNNGNCGGNKKPKPCPEKAKGNKAMPPGCGTTVEVEAAAATVTCPASAAGMTIGVCGVTVASVDSVIESAAAPATIEVSGDAATAEEADVLGERIERPATKPETLTAPATLASKLAGGILPFTGTDITMIVGIGICLILAGLLIARRRSAAE